MYVVQKGTIDEREREFLTLKNERDIEVLSVQV